MHWKHYFLLVLISGGVALATGEWEHDDDSSTSDDGFEEADVGGVDGWVGGLEGFQTSQQGSGYKTTGKVGTVWDGEQPTLKNKPEKVEKVNTVTHAFTREQGGPATRDVGVQIDSSVKVSGSARQSNPIDNHVSGRDRPCLRRDHGRVGRYQPRQFPEP